MMFIPTAAPLSAWLRFTQAAGNLDKTNSMQVMKGTSERDFYQKYPLIPDDLANTLREDNALRKQLQKALGKKELDLTQIFYCVGNIMKGL